MIKVECKVRPYEINGTDTNIGLPEKDILIIESHGIYNDRVVFNIDGRKYTYICKDLIAAIDNASNSARF